jgi:hypothetical protein
MLLQQLSSVKSVKQPSSTTVLPATEAVKIAKIKPARMAANWREADANQFGTYWIGALV